MPKLILGYIIEECPDIFEENIPENVKNRWITDARLLPENGKESGIAGIGTPGTEPWRLPVRPEVPLANALQSIRDVFTRTAEWQMELFNIVAFGGGVKEILSSAAKRTPNHIYIANMSFKVLAYTENTDIDETSATWRYQVVHGYLPPGVMKGMIETGEFEQLNHFHTAEHMYSQNFYVPFATRNIFYGNRPQAHLFVVNITRRPCFQDLIIAETLADFIENHYFLLSEYHLNRLTSNFDAFFADVVGGRLTDEKMIAKQILFFDWSIDDPYRMAAAYLKERSDTEAGMLSYELESISQWHSFRFGEYMVFLLNEKNAPYAAQAPMLEKAARKHGLSVCAGSAVGSLLSAAAQFELLRKIISLEQKMPGQRKKQSTLWPVYDMALPYLLENTAANPEMASLAHPDAARLADADRQGGTDWVRTYLTYLKNDRNIVRTAAELHIHRNTLTYRLEKIRELLTIDEEDFRQRTHLMLTMLAREVGQET